jgi:hypothetical protein
MDQPQLQPREDETDAWTIIERGISDIIHKAQSAPNLSLLQSSVEKVLASPTHDRLVVGLKSLFTSLYREWHVVLSSATGSGLISGFGSYFGDVDIFCGTIPEFYMPYDRSVNPEGDFSQTRLIIRELFADIILRDDQLIGPLLRALCVSLGNARVSHDSTTLEHEGAVLRLFYSFQSEKPILPLLTQFIDQFRLEVAVYYDDYFKTQFASHSFDVYLEMAATQFEHEEGILRQVLRPQEQNLILAVLNQSLLVGNDDVFLEKSRGKGLPPIAVAMIADNRHPIKWLVQTYTRFGVELTNLYKSCANFVYDEMISLIRLFQQEKQNPTDIASHVKVLIGKVKQLTVLYHEAFGEVPKAQDALDNAIRCAWNSPDFNIPINFATYIDVNIQDEFKRLDPGEVEAFPGIVGEFYGLTEDKEAFVHAYSLDLTHRFIRLRGKLETLEYPIIAAIRRSGTPEFAANYPKFLQATREAEGLATEFKNSLVVTNADLKIQEIETNPLVFEQRDYPLLQTTAEALPPEIGEINDLFIQFYVQKYERATLVLMPEVSQVEVTISFPANATASEARTYTVSLDLSAATLLHAIFEKTGSGGIVFGDLAEKVESRDVACQYVSALCSASTPLVKRTGNGPEIENDDVLEMNREFFSQNPRFTVSPVIRDRKDQEQAILQQMIDADRSAAISATAVRILKVKNRVEQDVLENDVVQALSQHFRAEIGKIKQELLELEARLYLTKEIVEGRTILTYRS